MFIVIGNGISNSGSNHGLGHLHITLCSCSWKRHESMCPSQLWRMEIIKTDLLYLNMHAVPHPVCAQGV